MQVFEHDGEQLHLALVQEHPVGGIERALAPLGRVQALLGRDFDGHLEQREERG
jgi:hypothetical protein